MSFGGAIAAFFRGYSDFGGRAGRAEFWWALLFWALVASACGVLVAGLTGRPLEASAVITSDSTSWLALLWTMATVLPLLAVGVRRLRDAGHPWPFMFFLLVPAAGFLILAIFWVQSSKPAAVEPRPEG